MKIRIRRRRGSAYLGKGQPRLLLTPGRIIALFIAGPNYHKQAEEILIMVVSRPQRLCGVIRSLDMRVVVQLLFVGIRGEEADHL